MKSKKPLLFTLVSTLTIAVAGQPHQQTPGVTFVIPQEYIGGIQEPAFKDFDGTEALGIFGGQIQKVRPKVSRTDHDRTCTAKSEWCSVRLEVAGNPSFLLKMSSAFPEGEIDLAQVEGTRFPSGMWSGNWELQLKKKKYSLKYRQIGEMVDGYVHYAMTLRLDNRSVDLVNLRDASLGPASMLGNLIWAGDINRDGNIDLILEASKSYCPGQYRLFLSKENDLEFDEFLQKEMGGCV